jgi:hypothetical protein
MLHKKQVFFRLAFFIQAVMAELADAIDLGSIVNRRAGSSPVNRSQGQWYKNNTAVFLSGVFV